MQQGHPSGCVALIDAAPQLDDAGSCQFTFLPHRVRTPGGDHHGAVIGLVDWQLHGATPDAVSIGSFLKRNGQAVLQAFRLIHAATVSRTEIVAVNVAAVFSDSQANLS